MKTSLKGEKSQIQIMKNSLQEEQKMLSDIYQRFNFAGVEPEHYEEAIKHDVWKKAMEEEIRMIEKNNTWELEDIPREREFVSLKWIYKIKLNQEGDIQK